MPGKVIILENRSGPFQMVFQRLMRMVPDRDKNDPQLRRLLAFRLGVDGEASTREYLMRIIRDAIQNNYNGRLYDLLASEAPAVPFPPHIAPPPSEPIDPPEPA